MGSKEDLDDLKWSSPRPVEPGAGTWKLLPLPDPRSFDCPPPPENDSKRTRAELKELRKLTAHRTPGDIEQIYRWSRDEPSLLTHWTDLADELCRKYRLSPPAGGRVQYYLAAAMQASIICAWHWKWRYLRPRPTDLDMRVDASVIPVPQHPAYPSGHSTSAGAGAEVLKRFFPDDAAQIDALAEDSGLSRLKAGIHFRSDHTVGLRLGKKVARGILELACEDGGPTSYR